MSRHLSPADTARILALAAELNDIARRAGANVCVAVCPEYGSVEFRTVDGGAEPDLTGCTEVGSLTFDSGDERLVVTDYTHGIGGEVGGEVRVLRRAVAAKAAA